ncbi:20S proteasome, regulatory subunit alpha type PSMA6/SCL1 [Trachipleistophora hominis]|uniref:20S proteasome, regulatory subunit alpha type PSMA6/SCL1 n=1 Tax=Trachipleistophora hominis TaxID=72359 RepID=L7JRX7_TRAHO|nr:20S proteasome, regulatory subunit alpha type PSMA6/SCL1 [Trachipleistophora hominis]
MNPSMTGKHEYYAEFCPEGTLKMVEYALEAASTGIPLIVLRTKDAIYCAAKKQTFESLEIPKNFNIVQVSEKVHLAISGFPADIDQIVNSVKDMAAKKTYELGFDVTADILARNLADERQELIQRSGERPMAFTAIFFGFDENTPLLYHTDTSAVFYSYYALGVGENSMKMNKYLEKGYHMDMDHAKALFTVVKGLSESIGNEFSPGNISVCYTKDNNELKYLNVKEIDTILQKISESE